MSLSDSLRQEAATAQWASQEKLFHLAAARLEILEQTKETIGGALLAMYAAFKAQIGDEEFKKMVVEAVVLAGGKE